MAASQAAPFGDFGLGVGRDQPGARARLDRHVANGHPPFHRQSADRRARIFDHMASAAGCADLADDREHDILGADPLAEHAIDGDPHILGLVLDQGLGGKNMLEGADAMRERAKGAMRRGMAIAADDRRARQRKTLFGADHMNDALAKVVLIEIFDAELPGILGELFDLNTAFGIVDAMRAIGGGDIVIDDRERFLRRTRRPLNRNPSKACGLVTSCTRWRSM